MSRISAKVKFRLGILEGSLAKSYLADGKWSECMYSFLTAMFVFYRKQKRIRDAITWIARKFTLTFIGAVRCETKERLVNIGRYIVLAAEYVFSCKFGWKTLTFGDQTIFIVFLKYIVHGSKISRAPSDLWKCWPNSAQGRLINKNSRSVKCIKGDRLNSSFFSWIKRI